MQPARRRRAETELNGPANSAIAGDPMRPDAPRPVAYRLHGKNNTVDGCLVRDIKK